MYLKNHQPATLWIKLHNLIHIFVRKCPALKQCTVDATTNWGTIKTLFWDSFPTYNFYTLNMDVLSYKYISLFVRDYKPNLMAGERIGMQTNDSCTLKSRIHKWHLREIGNLLLFFLNQISDHHGDSQRNPRVLLERAPKCIKCTYAEFLIRAFFQFSAQKCTLF